MFHEGRVHPPSSVISGVQTVPQIVLLISLAQSLINDYCHDFNGFGPCRQVWQLTATPLPVICGLDLQETMTMDAGYLAHSQMTQGNGFYNLPSVRKSTALVTIQSKFRVSEAY
jgi:hypothetical protein